MARRNSKKSIAPDGTTAQGTAPVQTIGIEVKNLTPFKQCFTFVAASGHLTITLRPGERKIVEGVGRDSILYYINNNNIQKVSTHGSL
jgi:hypothetical protein